MFLKQKLVICKRHFRSPPYTYESSEEREENGGWHSAGKPMSGKAQRERGSGRGVARAGGRRSRSSSDFLEISDNAGRGLGGGRRVGAGDL